MPAKIPIHRDQNMEQISGLRFEACAAYAGKDKVKVVGEVVSASGKQIDDYREIQVIVYDADGDILGREFTNWSEFQVRQSFEIEVVGLPSTPSRVKVFPAK